MPNGASSFVQSAMQLGIDTIFTLVGDHLNEVLMEAAQRGIRIVDMRHESGVTHAADAWARIHRKPALSLVTGGPGHTNSLTGIATANLAGSPLIAVSGSRPRSLADRKPSRISTRSARGAPPSSGPPKSPTPRRFPSTSPLPPPKPMPDAKVP